MEFLKTIAALERDMLASLMRLYPDAGEDEAVFACRKHRELSKLIPFEKSWAAKVCKAVLSYEKHVQRNHSNAWCASLSAATPDFTKSLRKQLKGKVASIAGALFGRQEPNRPRFAHKEGLELAREYLKAGE